MLQGFICDEAGAIAIDWVALTAGILLLGIGVVYALFGQQGVGSVVSEIQGEFSVMIAADVEKETGTAPFF